MSALADLAAALASSGAETPPEGWQTINQYAEAGGVQCAQAGNILRQALAAGLVERRQFRIMTGAGVRPVLHYRRKP